MHLMPPSPTSTETASPPAWSRLLPALLLLAALIPKGAGGDAAAAEPFRPPEKTADGFLVPQPGRVFSFPRDHGSHPGFRIEWWYITGHLHGDGGRRFGFQATFFRRSAPRDAVPGHSTAAFGHDQIYLAHMALLDVQAGRFIHEERLNRAGWDATAATSTLAVTNGNWSLTMTDPAREEMRLIGSVRGDVVLQLVLTPRKPLVVFGADGVSRKAADPTAASHYLTFSRLEAGGTVRVGREAIPVRGEAWMDHEISSSQLSEDQAGWDWASLQLHDGREIMAYRMRRHDGSTDPFSTLAWVDRQGGVTHRSSTEFSWEPAGTWRSSATGAVYPIRVRLRTVDPETGRPAAFWLEPLAPDQELTGAVGGIAYWEGACRVLDEERREIGSAFLELTGYSGHLGDRFR